MPSSRAIRLWGQPCSINCLIVAAGSVSIAAMFMAGFIPGVLTGPFGMFAAGIVSVAGGYGGESLSLPRGKSITATGVIAGMVVWVFLARWFPVVLPPEGEDFEIVQAFIARILNLAILLAIVLPITSLVPFITFRRVPLLLIVYLSIGMCTPPVGTWLFVGCKVGGTTIAKAIRPMLPFYAAMLVALMSITCVPTTSLWLLVQMGQLKADEVEELNFRNAEQQMDDADVNTGWAKRFLTFLSKRIVRSANLKAGWSG